MIHIFFTYIPWVHYTKIFYLLWHIHHAHLLLILHVVHPHHVVWGHHAVGRHHAVWRHTIHSSIWILLRHVHTSCSETKTFHKWFTIMQCDWKFLQNIESCRIIISPLKISENILQSIKSIYWHIIINRKKKMKNMYCISVTIVWIKLK